MSFSYEVYKSQRIVPLRFIRAATNQPVLGKPDIDDRGYFRAAVTAGNDHGHVVGITEGNESEVKVQRVRIDKKADLFVTSSDSAKMTVTSSGGTDKLANDTFTTIKIKGVLGGATVTPETAKVEVRYGNITGPIIGEISVWIFKPLTVSLTPHNVTVNDSTPAAGVNSSVNINDVIKLVKAFWEPCGVSFNVGGIENDSVTFANVGEVRWKNEINTILSTNRTADSINVYFVNELVVPGLQGFLGFGFSRTVVNSDAGNPDPLPHPGIILADQTTLTPGGVVNRHTDTHFLANDLAHEIGHFFTLAHVDNRNANPNPRNDTWAARMLMHPVNTRLLPGFRNDTGYGVAANGQGYRGGLITMKDVTGFSTDGESIIARGAIDAGPY